MRLSEDSVFKRENGLEVSVQLVQDGAPSMIVVFEVTPGKGL